MVGTLRPYSCEATESDRGGANICPQGKNVLHSYGRHEMDGHKSQQLANASIYIYFSSWRPFLSKDVLTDILDIYIFFGVL